MEEAKKTKRKIPELGLLKKGLIVLGDLAYIFAPWISVITKGRFYGFMSIVGLFIHFLEAGKALYYGLHANKAEDRINRIIHLSIFTMGLIGFTLALIRLIAETTPLISTYALLVPYLLPLSFFFLLFMVLAKYIKETQLPAFQHSMGLRHSKSYIETNNRANSDFLSVFYRISITLLFLALLAPLITLFTSLSMQSFPAYFPLAVAFLVSSILLVRVIQVSHRFWKYDKNLHVDTAFIHREIELISLIWVATALFLGSGITLLGFSGVATAKLAFMIPGAVIGLANELHKNNMLMTTVRLPFYLLLHPLMLFIEARLLKSANSVLNSKVSIVMAGITVGIYVIIAVPLVLSAKLSVLYFCLISIGLVNLGSMAGALFANAYKMSNIHNRDSAGTKIRASLVVTLLLSVTAVGICWGMYNSTFLAMDLFFASALTPVIAISFFIFSSTAILLFSSAYILKKISTLSKKPASFSMFAPIKQALLGSYFEKNNKNLRKDGAAGISTCSSESFYINQKLASGAEKANTVLGSGSSSFFSCDSNGRDSVESNKSQVDKDADRNTDDSSVLGTPT